MYQTINHLGLERDPIPTLHALFFALACGFLPDSKTLFLPPLQQQHGSGGIWGHIILIQARGSSLDGTVKENLMAL